MGLNLKQYKYKVMQIRLFTAILSMVVACSMLEAHTHLLILAIGGEGKNTFFSNHEEMDAM